MDIGFADGGAEEEHVRARRILCLRPSALVERRHLHCRIAARGVKICGGIICCLASSCVLASSHHVVLASRCCVGIEMLC